MPGDKHKCGYTAIKSWGLLYLLAELPKWVNGLAKGIPRLGKISLVLINLSISLLNVVYYLNRRETVVFIPNLLFINIYYLRNY